jgi:hypothetical protein
MELVRSAEAAVVAVAKEVKRYFSKSAGPESWGAREAMMTWCWIRLRRPWGASELFAGSFAQSPTGCWSHGSARSRRRLVCDGLLLMPGQSILRGALLVPREGEAEAREHGRVVQSLLDLAMGLTRHPGGTKFQNEDDEVPRS